MVKKNDHLEISAIDDSDSSEHCKSESEVLRLIEEQLKCRFTSEKLDLGGGVTIEIDGIDREKKILCEVYCHMGKLKGSQPDKVAADVLKLVFVDQAMGGQWKKLCVLQARKPPLIAKVNLGCLRLSSRWDARFAWSNCPRTEFGC